MKFIAQLTLSLLFVGVFSTAANAQILNRLEKKVESKVERRVERRVDKSIDKGLDKAEDELDEAATKKKEDPKTGEENATTPADSGGTSLHWMEYPEMMGFEDVIEVTPVMLMTAQIALLPRRQG